MFIKIYLQNNTTMAISRKEGNVLFNDALNTFYLRLYGIRHMLKDHSDNERRNLLPLHGLHFLICSKGSFLWPFFYIRRRSLAGTRNSSMGPTWRIDTMTHRTMNERSYHRATQSGISVYWLYQDWKYFLQKVFFEFPGNRTKTDQLSGCLHDTTATFRNNIESKSQKHLMIWYTKRILVFKMWLAMFVLR